MPRILQLTVPGPSLLLQVVADADMVGQDPKALMPIGGAAGRFSTTSLVTCRNNPRASTNSIRWIAGLGVCLDWGQAEEIREGS